MTRLSPVTWISNAFTALCGHHGDVTRQAQDAGCSRQTVYDHAAKVQQALADTQSPGPSRQQLQQDNQRLQQENQQLRDRLAQSLDCPEDKLKQFTTAGSAMGLSLWQILSLLAILLPRERRPSRATLGRWVHQEAKRAGRLLAILDHFARQLVLCVCLDEIFFHRQPVLMAVEPHSLAWVVGIKAQDRSGLSWAQALAALPKLTDVSADGGSGIEKGLELAFAQRQEAAAQTGEPAQPYRVRLDPFHVGRDGGRALRVEWSQAETVWEAAEKAERAKARYDRTGRDRRHCKKSGPQKAWAKAEAAFATACAKERAWQRALAALQVFRPDGQLNDRVWAAAALRAAAAELTGQHWAKVRRQLLDERLLTFLDRLQEDLRAVEPCPERRTMLVALWSWGQAERCASRSGEPRASVLVQDRLKDLLRARLGPGGETSLAQVGSVLRRVFRASSAVECLNSVVRMHQARHRNLTQELLDLKRLYWNCRELVSGKRRGRCPYEHLGLKLPSYQAWELLQMDPETLQAELTEQLSNSELAA